MRKTALSWLINLVALGLTARSQTSHDPAFGNLGVQRTAPLVPSSSFPYVFTSLPREYEDVVKCIVIPETAAGTSVLHPLHASSSSP